MRDIEVTHSPIEPHIDRDTVLQVKARFLQLNRQRLAQAKQHFTLRQQQCIDLLPLLFHYNHPRLPGYQQKNTPSGFANYTPTVDQLKIAKHFAKGFKDTSSATRKTPLFALYVMGSTGTVAQSSKSDMDFWLCHSQEIETDALKELEKKCDSLSSWAKSFDLDWHFFLMQPEAFCQGEHGRLSKEGSGSSQHFLLLDEFYRSSILLAGQIPMWWFIGSTDEEIYQKSKENISKKGFLRPQEWLDFGPIGKVPASEFVSAAVWQLYKSIASPFKSLLKLLILEVYLSKHPAIFTLADQMKLLIYAGQFNTTTLDPYLMLLKELSRYFIEKSEFERLEQMRQCFYFKLQKPYSTIKNDGSHAALLQLLTDWRWQDTDFLHIDNSTQWNAQQVMYERRKVIKELTASYRSLLEKARQAQPSINVNSQEITILGRKLHATFERSTGKIEFINPGISQNISANYLIVSFNKENKEWQAFLTNNRWEKSRVALISSSSILELLSWCVFNNILTVNTRLRTLGAAGFGNVETERFIRIISTLDIDTYLLPLHKAFTNASKLALAVVFVNDPSTMTLIENWDAKSLEIDSLNTANGSLVQNFSVLSINTWGEVRVQTLGSSLSNLLDWLGDQHNEDLTLVVRCLDSLGATLIEKRLSQLCQNVMTIFANRGDTSDPTTNKQQLLLMDNNQFLLCFYQQHWQTYRAHDAKALWQLLAKPSPQDVQLLVDNDSIKHPMMVGTDLPYLAQLTGKSLHLVYRQQGNHATVYCRDERGSLIKFEQLFFNEAALLKPFHHFLRNVLNRNPIAGGQSMFGIFPIEFYEIVKRNAGDTLEQRHASSDLANIRLFELQLCVETIDMNAPAAGWQVSAWLNGEQVKPDQNTNVFQKVAEMVLAHRHSNQRYPCYITDLDLSLCAHQIQHFDRLQTSHFVQVKIALEQVLNLELGKL